MADVLNNLRQQIKIKLQDLAAKDRTISSQIVTKKIIQHNIFLSSQNIACYIPIENEIDTWEIIKTIWHQNKNCYLPALDPEKEKTLCFVRFLPNDQLLKINKKFREPEINLEKTISPKNLDLVIVPLIGFNSDNFRLGRGIGCYDRTFAFKKKSPHQIKPYLIGIGYKWQHVEFENNPWDVVMDEIFVA